MSSPQRRRDARHASGEPAAPPKAPLSAERITSAALALVAEEGYDALTMRSLATRLGTGPASLYAHVVNKADLDELLIGRLCRDVLLPTPEPNRWREQITDVCVQLRDRYLAYPGISRAALAIDVTDLDVLRVNEGMLAILIGAGIAPQTAAWAIDALFLYVGAYAMDVAAAQGGGGDSGLHGSRQRADLIARFENLPSDRFPQIRAHARALTSGTEHERFSFTLDLLLRGLPDSSAQAAPSPTA